MATFKGERVLGGGVQRSAGSLDIALPIMTLEPIESVRERTLLGHEMRPAAIAHVRAMAQTQTTPESCGRVQA